MFKKIGFVVGVICATWLVVILFWSAFGIKANSDQIILYLGLLPFATVLLSVVTWWAFANIKDRNAKVVSSDEAAKEGETIASDDTKDEKKRFLRVRILGSSVKASPGVDASALWDLGQDFSITAQVDENYQDVNGMPAMLTKISDLPLDDYEESFRELRQENFAVEDGDKELSDAFKRAVLALEEPLENAIDSLTALLPSEEGREQTTTDGGSSRDLLVKIVMSVPQEWTPLQHKLVKKWVLGRIGREFPDGVKGIVFEWAAVYGEVEKYFAQIDTYIASQEENRELPLLWCLACGSFVNQEFVQELSTQNSLYDPASCPKGRICGEGAASVLLAYDNWENPAEEAGSDEVKAYMHRMAYAKRSKPIGGLGKVSFSVLAQLIDNALNGAQVESSKVQAICHDADTHSNRSGEWSGVMLKHFSHLEDDDISGLGTHTGYVSGGVSYLIVLATLASQLTDFGKVTVALGLQDELYRCAQVLCTDPDPEEAEDSEETLS